MLDKATLDRKEISKLSNRPRNHALFFLKKFYFFLFYGFSANQIYLYFHDHLWLIILYPIDHHCHVIFIKIQKANLFMHITRKVDLKSRRPHVRELERPYVPTRFASLSPSPTSPCRLLLHPERGEWRGLVRSVWKMDNVVGDMAYPLLDYLFVIRY